MDSNRVAGSGGIDLPPCAIRVVGGNGRPMGVLARVYVGSGAMTDEKLLPVPAEQQRPRPVALAQSAERDDFLPLAADRLRLGVVLPALDRFRRSHVKV